MSVLEIFQQYLKGGHQKWALRIESMLGVEPELSAWQALQLLSYPSTPFIAKLNLVIHNMIWLTFKLWARQLWCWFSDSWIIIIYEPINRLVTLSIAKAMLWSRMNIILHISSSRWPYCDLFRGRLTLHPTNIDPVAVTWCPDAI